MVIAILADDVIRQEILAKGVNDGIEVVWADSLQSLRVIEADAYFDLLFENDSERIARLKFLQPKPVVVNGVITTTREIGGQLIRINAWPTMINRSLVEMSLPEDPTDVSHITHLFNAMGWQIRMVPDVTGMITPRIISMIINEAWYAFHENISTREEIDTAMKLGTNYPYGPFEWGEKIGMGRVKALLEKLQKADPRYSIAPPLNGKFVWR